MAESCQKSANLESSGEGDTELNAQNYFDQQASVSNSLVSPLDPVESLKDFFLKVDCIGISVLLGKYASLFLESTHPGSPPPTNSETVAAAASCKLTEIVEKCASILSNWERCGMKSSDEAASWSISEKRASLWDSYPPERKYLERLCGVLNTVMPQECRDESWPMLFRYPQAPKDVSGEDQFENSSAAHVALVLTLARRRNAAFVNERPFKIVGFSSLEHSWIGYDAVDTGYAEFTLDDGGDRWVLNEVLEEDISESIIYSNTVFELNEKCRPPALSNEEFNIVLLQLAVGVMQDMFEASLKSLESASKVVSEGGVIERTCGDIEILESSLGWLCIWRKLLVDLCAEVNMRSSRVASLASDLLCFAQRVEILKRTPMHSKREVTPEAGGAGAGAEGLEGRSSAEKFRDAMGIMSPSLLCKAAFTTFREALSINKYNYVAYSRCVDLSTRLCDPSLLPEKTPKEILDFLMPFYQVALAEVEQGFEPQGMIAFESTQTILQAHRCEDALLPQVGERLEVLWMNEDDGREWEVWYPGTLMPPSSPEELPTLAYDDPTDRNVYKVEILTKELLLSISDEETAVMLFRKQRKRPNAAISGDEGGGDGVGANASACASACAGAVVDPPATTATTATTAIILPLMLMCKLTGP